MDDPRHKQNNPAGDNGTPESDKGEPTGRPFTPRFPEIPGAEASGTTDGELWETGEEGEG